MSGLREKGEGGGHPEVERKASKKKKTQRTTSRTRGERWVEGEEGMGREQ